MGNLDIDIDVDEDGITEELEDAIQDGMEEAAEGLANQGTDVAKEKIHQEGAIWNEELLNSFDNWTEERKGEVFLTIQNDADHAGPQEYGVEPSAYADGGPPIQNLLPWVRDELSGWSVEPGYADYVVGILGGEDQFPGYSKQEIAKGFWLQQKIKKEGLDAVEFMATAKKYIEQNGDYVTKRSVETSLRKHGFL